MLALQLSGTAAKARMMRSSIDLGSLVLEYSGFEPTGVRLATDAPGTSSVYGPFAQLILESEEAGRLVDQALDEDAPEELNFDPDC